MSDESAVVMVQLPVSLIERIRHVAAAERLSINQWCALAIASAAQLERGGDG